MKQSSRLSFQAIAIGTAVLAMLLVFSKSLYFVPENNVGLVWSRFGKIAKSDALREPGLTIISPLNRLYLYSLEEQTLARPLGLLDKQGKSFSIHLELVFKLDREHVPIIHKRIGPDYKERFIAPKIESLARVRAAQNEFTGYVTNQNLSQTLIADIRESFYKKGFMVISFSSKNYDP